MSWEKLSRLLPLYFFMLPIFAQDVPYAPCPILGPRFPMPTGLSTSSVIQEALVNLTQAFDELTTTGNSGFTATTTNTTSFSVVLFAANENGNNSEPYFYEYHHTASSLNESSNGTTSVDANSIYNIGSLTPILTVYAFLIAGGEELWLSPVTQFVSGISSTGGSSISTTVWNEIRLIDLATYLAGVPRIDSSDTLSDQNIPKALASILPPSVESSANTSALNREQFIDIMTTRMPIYLPGTTPIYSDAAFQMLALAVENITGKTYAQVMQESIFDVLNMSSSTTGTPQSVQNAVIPVNSTTSGWQTPAVEDSFLFAAQSVYSTAHDMSLAGRAILQSTLISPAATRRWFKPHSHTSNLVNDVGAPWEIYKSTLTGTSIGAVVPVYTKLGVNGLYSSYFGIVPDYNVGFVILSADTNAPADLNAYADIISTTMGVALEKTAIQEAAVNFMGDYTGVQASSNSNVTLGIEVDGLSGLSVSSWTVGSADTNNSIDIRAAYAEMASLPPSTLDFRLYPTNLESSANTDGERQIAFRAVLQDTAAPVDAGTPTCVTWANGVDSKVWNGESLDEFVFVINSSGSAVAVMIPGLEMTLTRDK